MWRPTPSRSTAVDNLTHSLVGLLLRRAGLGKGIARPTLVCVLAANAPDLDLVMGLSAPEYLIWHRHATHAVVAVPVMAFAAVLIAWAVHKARRSPEPWRWRAAWLTALVPAATHPLLDAMNSYAIRPWLPFSAEWRSFDALFVLDWAVWAILLAAALWPTLANLIAREIGAPGQAGRRAAWAGLAALTFYIGWKEMSHTRVVNALEARLWDGAPAKRVGAFPEPFDPRSWTGYVETGAYKMTLPVRADKLSEIERTEGRKYYPPVNAEAVEKAWETEMGRAYRQFSLFPLEIVEPRAEGTRVTLTDARFARTGRVGFACVIEVDKSGRVVNETFSF